MDQVFFTLAGILGVIGVLLRGYTLRLPGATSQEALSLYLIHVLALLLTATATLIWPYSPWPIWGGWAFTLGLVLTALHIIAQATRSKHRFLWAARLGYSAFILGWMAFILTPWFK